LLEIARAWKLSAFTNFTGEYPMPGKAAKVIITEKQQAILQSFANSRSVSVALAQRSKIILLAFQGHNNEAIEGLIGLQHDAVGRWRRRWRDNWERLIDIECAEERHVLENEIRTLLSDRARSGRPPRIEPEQQAAIFKVACEEQKKTDDRSLVGAEANFVSI
jgi:transposase